MMKVPAFVEPERLADIEKCLEKLLFYFDSETINEAYLYGSVVNNCHTDTSDTDILIIFKETPHELVKRKVKEIEREININSNYKVHAFTASDSVLVNRFQIQEWFKVRKNDKIWTLLNLDGYTKENR